MFYYRFSSTLPRWKTPRITVRTHFTHYAARDMGAVVPTQRFPPSPTTCATTSDIYPSAAALPGCAFFCQPAMEVETVWTTHNYSGHGHLLPIPCSGFLAYPACHASMYVLVIHATAFFPLPTPHPRPPPPLPVLLAVLPVVGYITYEGRLLLGGSERKKFRG